MLWNFFCYFSITPEVNVGKFFEGQTLQLICHFDQWCNKKVFYIDDISQRWEIFWGKNTLAFCPCNSHTTKFFLTLALEVNDMKLFCGTNSCLFGPFISDLKSYLTLAAEVNDITLFQGQMSSLFGPCVCDKAKKFSIIYRRIQCYNTFLLQTL